MGGGETSGRTVAIAVGPVAVEVNELETGLLKALDDERRNAFDHLVPEHGVIFHPRPQTGAVDGEGLHKLDRVGVEAPWNIGEFYGSSYFCDPRGQIIAQASRDKDEVLTADLDLDMIAEVRRTWQFFRDRRPDMYSDLVKA